MGIKCSEDAVMLLAARELKFKLWLPLVGRHDCLGMECDTYHIKQTVITPLSLSLCLFGRPSTKSGYWFGFGSFSSVAIQPDVTGCETAPAKWLQRCAVSSFETGGAGRAGGGVWGGVR